MNIIEWEETFQFYIFCTMQRIFYFFILGILFIANEFWWKSIRMNANSNGIVWLLFFPRPFLGNFSEVPWNTAYLSTNKQKCKRRQLRLEITGAISRKLLFDECGRRKLCFPPGGFSQRSKTPYFSSPDIVDVNELKTPKSKLVQILSDFHQ